MTAWAGLGLAVVVGFAVALRAADRSRAGHGPPDPPRDGVPRDTGDSGDDVPAEAPGDPADEQHRPGPPPSG